jgi:lipopolysaccharide transport system ATP-binding protein
LRVNDNNQRRYDRVRSTNPITLEVEYALDAPITGLRVGVYMQTTRGEFVFTSFDTDNTQQFEQYSMRPEGHYISRCTLPPDLLNEGQYVLGINASSYRVKRYFQDENALAFSVDGAGAPGKQWPERRLGPVRPRLEWDIDVK